MQVTSLKDYMNWFWGADNLDGKKIIYRRVKYGAKVDLEVHLEDGTITTAFQEWEKKVY